ncbi:hypothetical protein AVEN_33376-1 [Araneus ventricosus]|uniref:Uncharacterized protein n=1 Tax=Araneus ventricosus TaxID=182803 RepID=A0A4Y2C262_ARAVE|nr:hypothetical protein AVEN_33376-1 [Araneus ventricosus]
MLVLGSLGVMIGEDLQKFSGSRVTRTIAIGRHPIRNLPKIENSVYKLELLEVNSYFDKELIARTENPLNWWRSGYHVEASDLFFFTSISQNPLQGAQTYPVSEGRVACCQRNCLKGVNKCGL